MLPTEEISKGKLGNVWVWCGRGKKWHLNGQGSWPAYRYVGGGGKGRVVVVVMIVVVVVGVVVVVVVVVVCRLNVIGINIDSSHLLPPLVNNVNYLSILPDLVIIGSEPCITHRGGLHHYGRVLP